MSDDANGRPSAAEATQRRWTELASTVLLALTSIVASWSGYQASVWGGVEATDYAQAHALHMESTRESTTAGQFSGLDVATFMGWVNANATGNDRLQQFYRKQFRPELEQAFVAWQAMQPMTNPQASPTPFTLPSYQSQHMQRSRELEKQGETLFQAGHRANHYADAFALGTVVFATVLFFCGITQQFKEFRIRVALLGMATLLLLYGVSKIVVLPSA